MDFSDINISEKQARAIALTIFDDIDSFIESHRQEYEAFLKNEETEVRKCQNT